MLYIYKRDNNYLELESDDTPLIDSIESHFTYRKIAWENKNGSSNRKIYDISLLDDRSKLPLGLYQSLIEFLKNKKISGFYVSKALKHKGKQIKKEDLKTIIKTWNLPDKFKTLRSYQLKAIQLAYNLKRATLISPTSSGKTIITYGICKLHLKNVTSKKRILIIVPRTQLVDQLYKDFEKYDINNSDNIAQYIKMVHSEYDKIITDDHKIIVGTWQSFQNFTDDNFFESIKYLFVDEVHKSADEEKQSLSIKQIIQIVNKCSNAQYRIGLTGTIFNEDMEEILKRKTIEGLYGQIRVITTSKYLQEKNYVAKVKIRGVIFDYGTEPYTKLAHNYNSELKYYRKFDDKINFMIKKMSKTNNNAIILFKTIAHGKRILKLMKAKLKDKTFYYIDGQVKNDIRLNVQTMLDKNNNSIVIGSYETFGEGISVDNIFHVFMAEDVKSRNRVIQAIGRGMRLYKDKDFVMVYDMIDKLMLLKGKYEYASIAYRHRSARLSYYKDNNYDFSVVGIYKVKK